MRQVEQTVLEYLHSFKKKPSHRHPHIHGLRYPKVVHKILDSKFLEKFTEVLIIGDVHGCYDELLELLKTEDCLNDNVLKIFVGDLINRGPKSVEVLDLLRRKSSSMLAVRGNHEEEVLKEHEYCQDWYYRTSRTNAWIRYLSYKNIDFLEELPYTISLPSLNAIIVHAGLVPGIILEHNSPYTMVHMRNIVDPSLVWEGGLQGTASTLQGKPWGDVWWGPEHVYFGHDAKKRPVKYSYATGLDTGCVHGYYLTGLFISGPRKGKYIKVRAFNEKTKRSYFYAKRLRREERARNRQRRAEERERKALEKKRHRRERKERRERRRKEKKEKKIEERRANLKRLDKKIRKVVKGDSTKITKGPDHRSSVYSRHHR